MEVNLTNNSTKKKTLFKVAIFILFILLLLFLSNRCANFCLKKNKIEYVDTANVKIVKYNEEEIGRLRVENAKLYDAVSRYQKEIDYLSQFAYDKIYDTGKVETSKKVSKESKDKKSNLTEEVDSPRTFVYENKPNDSLTYKLQINSTKEPNWYSLNVKVHDVITVVNKDKGNGQNELTIKTDNKADISDVTVFKKKKKGNIFNKIAIVPGVFYGYDVKNKNLGYGVGVTIGYNIFGTK